MGAILRLAGKGIVAGGSALLGWEVGSRLIK